MEQFIDSIALINPTRAIRKINRREKYWYERTSKVYEPIPNMGIQRMPRLIDYTENVIREGRWPQAFVDFILNAAMYSLRLTLYIEQGPFLFYPVFSIRSIHPSKKKRCLIKFTRSNLSEDQYQRMVTQLYSTGNLAKHIFHGLKKIDPLNSYEY